MNGPLTRHKRSFSVKVIKQNPTNTLQPLFVTTQPLNSKKQLISFSSEKQLTEILKKYYDKNYIKELVQYYNRQWDNQIQDQIIKKQYLSVQTTLLERIYLFKPLLGSLMQQMNIYSFKEFKILLGVNYQEFIKLIQSFQIISRLTSDYLDPRILQQKQDLQYLYTTMIRLYNPTGIGSQQSLKLKFDSMMTAFKSKKSQLSAIINPTLRSSFQFIIQIQKIIDYYQKQTIKYKSLLIQCQKQKFDAIRLLQKKTNFIPVQIDYTRVKEIKDEHKKQIMLDLDQNFVKFYKSRMKTYDKKIEQMKKQIIDFEKDIAFKNKLINNLEYELKIIRDSKPKLKQASTQINLFTQSSSISKRMKGFGYQQFIENVNSPFKFNTIVTSSFIHQLVLDKILADYQIIRHKHKLKSFKHFIYDWFIIKTGSKIVAQIFCKNFILSIKSLRKTHKRYQLIAKMLGISEVKQKSLLEDLDLIFCQTQLAWYYYLKALLAYRLKFSINCSGYPILPPINCEQVMKLPLRKTYQLIRDFLQEQGIAVPTDLNTKFDLYCINQISIFKQGTQQFQKERKQQIHILGQINFDTVAGFLIQYIGNFSCINAERFLRFLQAKIRQKNSDLSYIQFELIYKKVYKERRAKAENLYAKFVMTKQQDTLDLNNMNDVVFYLLQNQAPIRSIFQKVKLIKQLILDQKQAMKWQLQKKTTSHANSYQSFRQRYYLQFYDFYSSVRLLYYLFKSIRPIIKKYLKQEKRRLNTTLGDEQQSNEDEQHQEYAQKIQQIQNTKGMQIQEKQKSKKKSLLQSKNQQFKILLTKIPIFPRNVITIDQLVVHSMRRKDSIDITQYSWRSLREIMIIITQKNLKS